MASMKVCLVVSVFVCSSNYTSVHPEIDDNGWRINI